ncbi:MAG: glucan biosynthesis protein G [Xanthobacteraceae bacterium]|nr:glucan biosynthesis protein G [Xanthobacteraceae bacterium]
MDRRRLIAGLAAALPVLQESWTVRPAQAEQKPIKAFDAGHVRALAQQLASNPYKEPPTSLSKNFENLSYDQYRSIRYRPERALWRGDGLPFELQFFHRGFIFKDRVQVYEVIEGDARPVAYQPDLFTLDKIEQRPEEADAGFAGFRLHAPMQRQDYYDEVGVFLGASYFRAVAEDQVYGLSARALSIATGDPKGEEFPAFRAFWVERPSRRAKSLVVHALVDSKSAAAAARFDIRPGRTTTYDVDLTVYPRVDLAQIGIGSLTSMFFFAANDRLGVDDYRPAVHDSDGLSIWNGRGERLWRPLSNPRDLQISLFADENPRGFGLLQRERNFSSYQDLESHFEKRPSAWIEPSSEWGPGAIQLVEIPTKEEIHDNIVAFWRPKDRLRAKGEYKYAYRIDWGSMAGPRPLAEFVKTSVGAGPDNTRRFVLDMRGPGLEKETVDRLRATVSADKGEIRNSVIYPNPAIGGLRMSFELAPKNEKAIELRAQLMRDGDRISEVWLYRWTP